MPYNNGLGGCEPNNLGRLLYTQSPSPRYFPQPHTRHRQNTGGPGWMEESCPCQSDTRIQPGRRQSLRDPVAEASFWTNWHTGQGTPPSPQFILDLDALQHDEEVDGQLPDKWVAEFDQRHQSWYFVDTTTGRTQWAQPAIPPEQRHAKLARTNARNDAGTARVERLRADVASWQAIVHTTFTHL